MALREGGELRAHARGCLNGCISVNWDDESSDEGSREERMAGSLHRPQCYIHHIFIWVFSKVDYVSQVRKALPQLFWEKKGMRWKSLLLGSWPFFREKRVHVHGMVYKKAKYNQELCSECLACVRPTLAVVGVGRWEKTGTQTIQRVMTQMRESTIWSTYREEEKWWYWCISNNKCFSWAVEEILSYVQAT